MCIYVYICCARMSHGLFIVYCCAVNTSIPDLSFHSCALAVLSHVLHMAYGPLLAIVIVVIVVIPVIIVIILVPVIILIAMIVDVVTVDHDVAMVHRQSLVWSFEVQDFVVGHSFVSETGRAAETHVKAGACKQPQRGQEREREIMYIYIYVLCVYICIYAYMYMYMYIYICICLLTCLYICVHIHMHIHVYIDTYSYVYLCTDR